MASASDVPSPAAEEFLVVYVTVPSREAGLSLSQQLVSSQLAACVNMVPGVTSVYQWEGKVTTDEELLLVIKTRRALLQELTVAVKANHPYATPEVLALPVLGGSPDYLAWLLASTKSS